MIGYMAQWVCQPWDGTIMNQQNAYLEVTWYNYPLKVDSRSIWLKDEITDAIFSPMDNLTLEKFTSLTVLYVNGVYVNFGQSSMASMSVSATPQPSHHNPGFR